MRLADLIHQVPALAKTRGTIILTSSTADDGVILVGNLDRKPALMRADMTATIFAEDVLPDSRGSGAPLLY
jgi:hypothetical protein